MGTTKRVSQTILCAAHLSKTHNISEMDEQLATCPIPTVHKHPVDLQAELDHITSTDAERLLLRSCSTYCKYGQNAIRHQAASHMNRIA